MWPARATSPPNTFTPRRWPELSRPLRLLPCPFLCAMALVRCWCRLRTALEAGDAHHRQLLAMTLLAAVVLAALLFEHENLSRLLVTNDLAEHAKAVDERLPDLH